MATSKILDGHIVKSCGPVDRIGFNADPDSVPDLFPDPDAGIWKQKIVKYYSWKNKSNFWSKMQYSYLQASKRKA
jgi:hypothetical protein